MKGNTVVVGDNAYGSGDKGSVFAYNYDMQHKYWTQLKIHNDDCDENFGNSVELTKDGELFIGCWGEDSEAGAVYHYIPSSNGGLYKMKQKITASDRSSGDHFRFCKICR